MRSAARVLCTTNDRAIIKHHLDLMTLKNYYFFKPINTVLIDSFGREINYARLSVTDRCDFRCVYCMAEKMTFVPKKDVLSLEELYQTAAALIASGIRKIRLTGGEPLIRNDIMWLIKKIKFG